MAKSNLHKLSKRGQSVWIDSSRARCSTTGKLERLMKEDAVVGVTTNPTIFQKAISRATRTTSSCKELLEEETDAKEIFLQLAAAGRRGALDLLRRSGRASGAGRLRLVGGRPDPRVRPRGTFDEAMRLHAWIDKPNLYVKIPATKPGLGAIEDCIARGKNINVTLIFSLAALPRGRRGVPPRARAARRGRRRSRRRCIGRELLRLARRHGGRQAARGDRHEEALALRGKLAIANAKLAYEHYQEAFAGERWEFLAGKGATPQRCLWASTSTKNPEYRDVMYVEELIGPDTVNTMPEETIRAFQDHGEVRGDTVLEGVDEAQRAARASSPRPASTTTTSSRRSSSRACRSSPTRSTSCSTASARSAESSLAA